MAIPTTTVAIKEVIVASRKFPIVPRIVKVKQYHTNFPFYTNILQKHIDFALRICQEKRLSCVSEGIVSFLAKATQRNP
jgi:acetone carboxylase gamma subunit